MAKTVSFSKTVLAAVVAALSMGAAQAAQKEVTDVQGRKVKIESPAKRVPTGKSASTIVLVRMGAIIIGLPAGLFVKMKALIPMYGR